ncbi:YlbL family protein [Kutzneria sp. CA-103260]|uniref:YlbL family protein n=1 Tax=Kutzneria sp. CA-103260 TaxID=2802641 RepID=UPI0020119F4F|nr:PDZ domain-containing protein [Kutzneria sp. CA-103260]
MSQQTERPDQDTAEPQPPRPRRGGPARRTWTLVWSFVLVAAIGLLGGVVSIPYVAIGPGPTFNTLGSVDGTTVISVQGQDTFPTKGELRMVTVSLTDSITLFGALGLWASGRYSLAPREEYFKPGESQQDVQKQNVQEFTDSQSNAQVAALRYLGYPMKVLVGSISQGSPVTGVLNAGDRLLAVNGTKVSTSQQVQDALKSTKPGQAVPVTFQHGASPEQTATITLGHSDDRAWGFMGIGPIDRPDVPFQVKISLADVGGPSAGLIFALTIIDKLTPDNLNNGGDIAGTGEIDDQGNVKPIGGIPFKMIAAKEAGATAFLAPADNCAEAKAHAPDGLKLIKVTTLADAVSSLQALKAGKPTPGC